MKNIKWISAVLLAVLIAGPVFAQTDKRISKDLDKAVKKAMTQASREAKKKICAYCDEEIKSEGQHCSAQGSVALCTTQKETDTPTSTVSEDRPANCPKCGAAFTIDERYHGATHTCKSDTSHVDTHCIYCGEEIKSSDQKCTASKGVCTTSCPECNANLRNQANLDQNGVHHCRFKTKIKPVAAKK